MPAMLDAVATAQRQSGSESTVFLDARGAGRGLRVSWNPDGRTVVLSLWEGERCRATCHLPVEDAPRLISVLATDLGAALAASAVPPPSSPTGRALRPWRRLEASLRRRLGQAPEQGATVVSFPPGGRSRRQR